MRRPFRAAVVGVGHLGRHHARLLRGLADVELVGVVDADADRAAAVAAELGTRAASGVEELAADVDGVTVAVPTAAHAEVALPLLRAGIPVLVEKPIAASVEEADALLAAAEGAGATLAVGHTERYNPAVTTAQELVSAPRFIEGHRLAAFARRSLDVDVVFDLMIHDLDVVLAIVGAEPASIEAVGVPVLTERVDIANARIRFPNGCLANLTASRISRDRVRKLRVFEPQSYVSLDYGAQRVEAWRVTRNGGEPAIEGGAVAVPRAEPLERELADFVQASRTGARPRVTGADGRRALAVAQRIAAAIAAGPAAGPVGGPAAVAS